MKFRFRRRHVILFSSLLGGVLIAGYAAASILYWIDFRDRYNAMGGDFSAVISDQIAGATPITSSQQLRGTLDDFQDEYHCTVAAFYGWQTVFPPLRAGVEHCLLNAAALTQVQDTLSTLIVYMEAEEATARLLKDIPPITDTAGTSGVAARWGGVAESLPAEPSFQTARTAFAKASDTISEACNTLSRALADEAPDALDSALSNLDKGYAALRKAFKTSESKRLELIQAFTDAYSRLIGR